MGYGICCLVEKITCRFEAYQKPSDLHKCLFYFMSQNSACLFLNVFSCFHNTYFKIIYYYLFLSYLFAMFLCYRSFKIFIRFQWHSITFVNIKQSPTHKKPHVLRTREEWACTSTYLKTFTVLG